MVETVQVQTTQNLQYPQSLTVDIPQNSLMVDITNDCFEVNLCNPASCPLINALCSVWTHTKVHHRYSDLTD